MESGPRRRREAPPPPGSAVVCEYLRVAKKVSSAHASVGRGFLRKKYFFSKNGQMSDKNGPSEWV